MNKSNQNLTVGSQTGSRLMRFIITVMLVVPLMLGMTSCSSDDAKDDEPVVDNASELYGAWVAEETFAPRYEYGEKIESTLIFESKGIFSAQTIFWDIPRPGGAYDDIDGPKEYRYEVFSNTLKIYASENKTKTPDSVLSFKVAGDKLTLEYLQGDNPVFLSYFSNKAVTFTRK